MPEVITLGELLIDFVPNRKGVSLEEVPGFTKVPGGAPANVAVGVCRLGGTAGFIGKLGRDAFGRYLAGVLVKEGVDTTCLVFTPEAKTGLAFISLTAQGERDFLFYRDPSADMLLEPEEIDPGYLQGARVLHHGSISLIHETSRGATLGAVQTARQLGLWVSYDPNLRLPLWPSPEMAKEVIAGGLRTADLVKVNREELEFITGSTRVETGAERILAHGPRMVVVTLGAGGSFWLTRQGGGHVPSWQVSAVDATGAGDAFTAGLLTALLEHGKELQELSEGEVGRAVRWANAVGAITTTRYGAIPALPNREEVMALIKDRHAITNCAEGLDPAAN